MGFGASLFLFMFMMWSNGYGQSTGWPGLIKNMSTWFQHQERGVVMAWWCTCYVVGGFVGTIFATYWATNEMFFADMAGGGPSGRPRFSSQSLLAYTHSIRGTGPRMQGFRTCRRMMPTRLLLLRLTR